MTRDEGARGLQRLGQSKVQDLYYAVWPHLDVGGFEIAVNDALLVCRVKRIGDLLRDGERFVERNRPVRDAIRQCRSLDQLHHQRGYAGALLEAVNLRDIRMIQRCENFGLALKARQPFRVIGHPCGQHLDSDRSLQVDVSGLVHLAHAAFAELDGDFEGADADAGR